jgi:hypothetical protein
MSERYHDFQIKDHYYWDETPKVEAKPATAAKPAEEPRYKSWTVREADGSTTYYDAQVSNKEVRISGIMV